MTENKFTTKHGSANLHSIEGTHRIAYLNEFYFDAFGCPPPELSNFINERQGNVFFFRL